MIHAWFDGACEPINPGGTAAYGCIIELSNPLKRVKLEGIVGRGPQMSSNVAEYSGLIRILKWLLDNRFENEPVTIFGDSKLVIEQMSGHWKLKRGLYLPYAELARTLVNQFQNVILEWIPRESNTQADELSRIQAPRARRSYVAENSYDPGRKKSQRENKTRYEIPATSPTDDRSKGEKDILLTKAHSI